MLRGTWDLSSLSRNQTPTPCIARQVLNHWATREVPRPALSYLSRLNSGAPSLESPLHQPAWDAHPYIPMPAQNRGAACLGKTPALPCHISIILFTHRTSVLRRLNSVGYNSEAFFPLISAFSPAVLNLHFPSLNDILGRLHYFQITFCC